MTKRAPRPGPGRPPSIEAPLPTIRAAAAALFAEKGYEGTSLQDVATAVGVTKAGLYHYFPTKQALYDAIVMGALDDLNAVAAEAIGAQPGHPEQLVAFMRAHAAYFAEHHDIYRAAFFGRAGYEKAGYTDEQLAARKAYVRLLEDLLAAGVRAGSLSVPDVPTFARGILGMLNWMARWYRPDGPQGAAQIAESYARTLLAGIAPR